MGEATDEELLEGFAGCGVGGVAAGGDDVDAIEVSGAAVEQLDLEACFVEVFGALDCEQLLGGVLDQRAESLWWGLGAVGHSETSATSGTSVTGETSEASETSGAPDALAASR